MSFRANVLKVMIASPGDVSEERKIVTDEIYRWNDANASARQLVLLPVKWETHSTPQMGDHPQTIINRQLLVDADIVVGIFGTRIGTPTEEFVSGTVEEIKRHVAAGKTTKIYFSDVPIPPSELNPVQYASVRAFRDECKTMGLYSTFNSAQEFGREFSQHLSLELNQGRYKWLSTPEESDSEEKKVALTEEGLRLLKAGANDDGSIIFSTSEDGFGMTVGGEVFCDGTPRSSAKWRTILATLIDSGAVERVSEGIYRLTAGGYEIADQTEISRDPLKVNAFDEQRSTHALTLTDSLNPMQRDLLRLLLLKGSPVRGDVISMALANPAGGIDFNSLTRPLTQNGLLMRADDHREGYSTYTVNISLAESLKVHLFPRNEGDKPAFFKGI